MQRSFSFRCRTACKESNVILDVLCVFFARQPLDIVILTDEIQDCLKTNDPIPDVLYVIGTKSVSTKIAELWESHTPQTRVLLERGNPPGLSAIRDFAILSFENGGFSRLVTPSNSKRYSIEVEKLFRAGLAQLIEANSVYQLAPSGHIFKHPSGKNSKQFFLASELLRNEIDVYFVAMCVCIYAWGALNSATRIFIDTMGVYPIARAIEELLLSAGRNASLPWDVENFHSHEGFSGFHPILSQGDIALVSASTSGGLATKLHNEKGFRPGSIITILDVRRTGRTGWIVHANSDSADIAGEFGQASFEAQETPIELVGEYFAAKSKKPRALTLSTYHAPSSLKKILDAFHPTGACSLNTPRSSASAVDIVSLAPSVVATNSEILKWISDEIRMKTPASVSHVIGSDDEQSKILADAARDVLSGLQITSPKVLLAAELDTVQRDTITGVLVCSAVVGNGHALRLLSRDLREVCPSASRHFIVGVGAPDTRESWMRLRQFLTQSGNPNRPYGFSAWNYVLIGRKAPHDSWSRYSKLMQNLEHIVPGSLDGWDQTIVSSSIDQAGNLLDKSTKGFLPSTLDQPLKLTEGFIYWQPDFEKLEKANHECVSYLAITSVLQSARDFEDQTKRLRSTLHETVILDPENFSRFNDGILQAALLRSAYSYELDYSMSVDCSQSMRELLEKLLLNHHNKYGEAALEFAVALAAGHISLTKADSQVLFSKLVGFGKIASPLTGLIYAWWHIYVR